MWFIGVVQGSILGPVFSNIYLNDLHKVLDKMTLFSFADDSKLYYSNISLCNLIETSNFEFRKVAQWMRSNKLMLHPDKTQYMIFCPRQKPIDTSLCKLYLNNNDINSLSCNEKYVAEIKFLNLDENAHVRFLGLYLDPHLTFKHHVSVLSSRIAKGLYIIRTSKRLLSEKALRLLYFSLIHSHIIYAIQAYGCAEKSVLQPIIKLQKKAIRIVSNSKYNAHCDPIFKEIEILKFEDLVDFFQLCFMHTFHHGKLPKSFKNTWQSKSDLFTLNDFNLRDALDLHIITPKLSFTQKLPLIKFPSLWNQLDIEVRQTWPPSLFKKNLRTLMLEKLPNVVSCQNPFCSSCYES